MVIFDTIQVDKEHISLIGLGIMNDIDLWGVVLNEMELQTSRAAFLTWFKNTSISSHRDGVVSVAVPNGFTKRRLQEKYTKTILKVLRDTIPDIKSVLFVVETKKHSFLTQRTPSAVKTPLEGQAIFEEMEINPKTHLNPKYSFQSFVVGPSNELARAAAMAVVESPGHTHNPLFIYGGVGLGKTHLLQSIGNELFNKNKNVVYITSEQFTNEFIASIQNNTKNSFKEQYRTKDVLIIDDIQFIAGKEQTQEEFFHTFNTLYENNKQIILCSDRPPKAIATLEERLRSRFEGGMLADIKPPDYETRLAILQTKIKERNITMENSILEHIATSIKNNIRELEGALNLIVTSSRSLYDNQITQEHAKRIITNLLHTPQKPVSHKHIINTVARFYEIKEEEIMKKNRRREIVLPRQIVMFLMRKELKKSYPAIGEHLGGRDHTTVMHACDKIEKRIQDDVMFEDELNVIKQTLYST
ncbi:MAG: chromosomal replication initiator protein DnaA [Candidatus Spechtbacteria bacterium SB0662_bin_43]|uniref:Chromosomal replication initiator protein DnaA n=1 Tax=Candidatus Spechtbacteria bacterium SB0662_bin_43 TaxID=2604897 RepID=A0A845DJQ1_9BACT|nr:chromosomal replication initiator protein DnaA [Candidatus Spechtbacteria bacterium SB0662_bin_43]